MKTIDTKIYQCDYCPKYYKLKRFAERHELGCDKNAANFRICFSCKHLERVDAEITEVYSDCFGEINRRRKVPMFYCLKKGQGVYPPKIANKLILKNSRHNSAYEAPYVNGVEVSNEAMPLECEDYKNV